MSFLADEIRLSDIVRARKEDGLRDNNWQTAKGEDLNAIAANYEITRYLYEGDEDLRKRVERELKKKRYG